MSLVRDVPIFPFLRCDDEVSKTFCTSSVAPLKMGIDNRPLPSSHQIVACETMTAIDVINPTRKEM